MKTEILHEKKEFANVRELIQEGTYSMEAHLEVVLKNGATIGYSGGSGTPLGDGTTLNCSYQWMIPVNLDEVQAIRIGSVEIPVE